MTAKDLKVIKAETKIKYMGNNPRKSMTKKFSNIENRDINDILVYPMGNH